MKLFPSQFIIRHQAKLLFLVLWGHVTLLDLFYVTYSGPIFFWDETLRPYTQFIHLMVAGLSLGFYFVLLKLIARFNIIKNANPFRSSVRLSNPVSNTPSNILSKSSTKSSSS